MGVVLWAYADLAYYWGGDCFASKSHHSIP